MRLQVSRWGHSLAVRLPVECVRAAGLREGDNVVASVTSNGNITLVPEQLFDKEAFLSRVVSLQGMMAMTAPVVESMRQEDRC